MQETVGKCEEPRAVRCEEMQGRPRKREEVRGIAGMLILRCVVNVLQFFVHFMIFMLSGALSA